MIPLIAPMIPTIPSMISPALGVYKDPSPGISPPLAAVAALVVVAFAAFVRGPTKENEAVSYLRSGFDLLEKQETEQRELLNRPEEERRRIQDMEADRRRRELAIERATIALGQTRAGAVRKVREEERQQKEEEERQQKEEERRQKEDERRQGEEDNRIE
jgi:hypothetical protein